MPALIGTDNRGKMSKSAGNAIFLSDDEQTIRAKVGGMFTDPRRNEQDEPIAAETMHEVRANMGIDRVWKSLRVQAWSY